MDANARLEIETKLGQSQLAVAEALLAAKQARWDEIVLFGAAGIIPGLVIAQIFLR